MTGQIQPSPETILAAMRVDVYASKKRDDVWIMHDRPFDKKLVCLELVQEGGALDFLFEDGKRLPLGAPLRPDIAEKMAHMDSVLLYLVDVRTLKAKDAQTVPLTIRKADVAPDGKKSVSQSLAEMFGGG